MCDCNDHCSVIGDILVSYEDAPVFQFDVVAHFSEEPPELLNEAAFYFLGKRRHAGPADVRDTARDTSGIEGGKVRVPLGDDDSFRRKIQDLRRNLCHDRKSSVSEFMKSGIDDHGAVLAET